jgi:hypothetical protein
MTVQQIRELLKKEMDSGAVLEKLNDIQTTVAAALAARQPEQLPKILDTSPIESPGTFQMVPVKPPFAEEELKRRFNDARLAAGLNNLPLLVLAAYPTEPTNFEKRSKASVWSEVHEVPGERAVRSSFPG